MDRPIYANAVALTSSDDSSEYVLTFRHRYPEIDAKGELAEEKDDAVVSLVMTKEFLERLQNTLTEMLKK